jgi:hypothetical protein
LKACRELSVYDSSERSNDSNSGKGDTTSTQAIRRFAARRPFWYRFILGVVLGTIPTLIQFGFGFFFIIMTVVYLTFIRIRDPQYFHNPANSKESGFVIGILAGALLGLALTA